MWWETGGADSTTSAGPPITVSAVNAPCQNACTPWAELTDLPSRCADADPDQALQAIADATDILFMLSGQRFPGYCETVVRPCGRQAPVGSGIARQFNALTLGAWGDRTWSGFCLCNQQAGQCGCSRLSEVTLGVWPVDSITEVKLDGEVLDPARYRVDEYAYLVRLKDEDGSNPGWPCCQRMDLPSTEEHTFEVSVVYGTPPPGNGKGAAAALACQLLKARGGEACDLPPNVTQLSRQGVTLNIQSVVSLLAQGQTGVYEADLFLRTINQDGNGTRPSGFLVPNARRSARWTDT
jgi:hypothetical protein